VFGNSQGTARRLLSISVAIAEVRHFRVSMNVVVSCTEPDVAVTVIVEVTGGEVPPAPEPPPLPQPVSRLQGTTLIARANRTFKQLRFLKPRQQSANANATAGNTGPESR